MSDTTAEADDRVDFTVRVKKVALDRFRERFSDDKLSSMLGDMISDAVQKPEEKDHFRADYLSTGAALAIINDYGRIIDKRGTTIKKRLDCDLFQAAARHTGLIKHMTRYYGSSGKHMVHIPSLIKSAHGMLHWDWDYEDECQICPEKALCYDDKEDDNDA